MSDLRGHDFPRAVGTELTILDRVKLLIVTKFGARLFTRRELLDAWGREYPNINPEGKVLLSDYCVNTVSGNDYADKYRFLFRVRGGEYRIYDPSRDGNWKVTKGKIQQVA